MSRVLVLGARSLVGHFLMPRLLADGLEVHALSRRGSPHTETARPAAAPGGQPIWHAADLDVPGWSRGLTGMDVVISLAPLWLLPGAMAELRSLGPGRLIAFGSTSRHTKTDSPSPRERALAQRLARAEQDLAVQAGDMPWILLRPTMIYGAGLDANVSGIARFIRCFGFFPLAGAAAGLRQPVHADDLAEAVIRLLHVDLPMPLALDLGGGEALTYREMVLRVFRAMDLPPRPLTLPVPALRLALAIASRLPRLVHLDPAMIDRMALDMVFDNGPARELFGYRPRGFAPTVADLTCPQ